MADLANLRISVDSRDVKRAASDLDQLGRSSTGAEQGATKASSAFRGLGAVLASLGIAAIAREAIMLADTFTRMSGQLALVTNNAQQLASAEKQLFAMSQNTRVGYESTVSLFSRLARSTENLGVSQQSVMRVTETINKAMIVSGTSAEQASGSLMQLGQAFASGTLRGDELNSVMEGMPRVAQAIAEGMGITVGELRKLGAQGKLTGAEVFAALQKMGEDIDSEFKKMPMTVAQSMTVLSNSLMLFVAEADKATGFTAALAEGIVSLSSNLNQIARVAQVVIVSVAGMTAAFLAFRAALGIQAIVAYVSQLVAMQFALGATTTASALAGAGIKGLQAILASTGWGLAVVAIGAVVGAIYMLVTAQSEARGETQNLINDLGRLAATQDKNYAQAAKRGVAGLKDVQTERNILMERNKNIEAYTAKSGMVGKVAIEYKRNAAAIKEANAFLIQNGNAIIESNKVYNQAEPAIQNVSAAIEKTGKKAKEAIDPLQKYRDALADMVEEGQKIGMTPEQIKAFEVEKLALEAAAAGRKKYNKASQEGAGQNIANQIRQQGMLNALTQQAADIRQEVSEKLKDYAKSIVDANKAHNDNMTTLKGEVKLLGLVGVEREKEALLLEKTSYELKYGTTAWEEYHAARTSNIDAKSVIDKDIEALQTLANNLETAAGMIGGKGGRALQGILKMEVQLADGSAKKISEAIAKELPQLGNILAKVISGMQIGNLVGGMAGSTTGGTIGGGIGGALGKKLLTGGLEKIMPQLGQFAGPLGALAGGLLGGVIGGLLKKTKTGSVTLNQIAGGAMERTLTGNSAALKGIADNMANGLLKGLGNVAEQLGGTLGGNVRVSLGQRKKDFVVDPTGAGRTKGSGVINFGTDQAAAVAYVTQLAIQQGIVTGISAGAQTLIRAGNDLNEQVQKALKFDQVFKDLVRESDPLRASLDELSVEMEKLKVIFAEAGASAADYAKLEELYAIKQAKAIFEANRPRRELEIQLMEAQGRSVEALAASRQLELEAMDEGLRGIQRQIFAQQDLNAANEAVAAAETRVADARRAQREREIESMRAQIEGLDVIIARRETAQEALRQAYDAEISRIDAEISKRNDNIASLEDAYSSQASIIQGTIDQFRDFASTLRDFASSIIPMNGSGPQSLEALRRRFTDITRAALGGDTAAMGQVAGAGGELRESIIANASDRTSMLRQLFALQNQTLEFANQAEQQASIGEQQLTTLRAQYDAMIAAEQGAIAFYEAQKLALTAQVEQFITLNAGVLSVDEAIRQLQSAEQAAIEAEAQKATLLAQIDALLALDQTVIDLAGAERELADAQAQRDNLLMEINRNGFATIAYETRLLAAQAAAAAAQAAAAAAVLPNNVIPFPIMGGGFGAGGGNREFGINNNILPFANGGIHSGGLRIVGENGPELEATGPSRIYNANQLNGMMGGAGTAEEVKGLREELKLAVYQIAKNTGKSYNLMNRWDGNGLPDIREDASDYY